MDCGSENDGDDAFDIFDSPMRNTEDTEAEEKDNEDVLAQKRILIQISSRREVESYLDLTIIVNPHVNSLIGGERICIDSHILLC